MYLTVAKFRIGEALACVPAFSWVGKHDAAMASAIEQMQRLKPTLVVKYHAWRRSLQAILSYAEGDEEHKSMSEMRELERLCVMADLLRVYPSLAVPDKFKQHQSESTAYRAGDVQTDLEDSSDSDYDHRTGEPQATVSDDQKPLGPAADASSAASPGPIVV